MTRKSITINYKHIRKPYLTLKQRYRNKRKLKKLINRWKPIAIILLLTFIAYIVHTGTITILLKLEAKEIYSTIDSNIIYTIAPLDTKIAPKKDIIVPKVINDTPQKKTLVREVKNQPIRKFRITQSGSCYDYVDEMASKYKVDGEVMRKIIKAESGGNPNAKNKNSTASGCSQFIKSTWEGTLKQMGREYVSPFDARTNVEAMAFKISRGGIRAWDASKSKWSK